MPADTSESSLTVAQLCELLAAQPQDALVKIEGCDCDGLARDVEAPTETFPFVCICR